jgi:prevent-host-death family protein
VKGPRQVNVHEAKTRLSQLLAEVEGGQEIVVARNGTPVAKLVPFPKPARRRLRVDTWKGRLGMSPDFDAPLSEDELKGWGF